MDFIPRYKQPFSLAQAVTLDVETITEEIARLQNSLKHLRQTQETLQESFGSATSGIPVDDELQKAYEENQIVIASQEERILILKLALSEKGLSATAHYDPPMSEQKSSTHDTPTTANIVDNENGVYL